MVKSQKGGNGGYNIWKLAALLWRSEERQEVMLKSWQGVGSLKIGAFHLRGKASSSW